ncbi:MAG: AMP-binding protein [Gammaproteobacteria bacterium]|nr:AMP-binding protein [Gammaproteobacteria bacterium]
MPDKTIAIDGCDTLPKLFLRKSAERGDRIAMREKDFGIWQSYSWDDYRERALEIAHGLLSLGLQRGDVVSIQSEDCREWLWADVGAMLAGGVVNGIYPTYQTRQVEHALSDSSCRFLFVEDEEQLDKYLEIATALPNIEKVYVFDWRGLRGFEHDKVAPIERLYEIGDRFGRDNSGLIGKIVADGSGDDLAALVYTSGTTGLPKGAMLSQRYILFQMQLAPDYLRQSADDELLTYLPLCHIAERIFSGWLPLAHGATINFAESPETVMQNLQEVSPTYIFAVPRVWEKFYSRVTTAMSEATWLGRKAYELALAIGRRRAGKLERQVSLTVIDRLLFAIADRAVFRNIKRVLGLDRAEKAATAAAPISPDLLRWFLAMGIEIDELWGQTEIGIVTSTQQEVFRFGKVGLPFPGTDVRIDDNGEIVARSDGQFDGYLNLRDKTAETIVGGWIRTGDVGEIDEEGYLSITDRLKDIIITAGGKNITPSVMENELKFSPYISDAVIIGDRRKYLSCLIMIDQENVEHFAQTHSVPFTDYRSLCARPEIVELINKEVTRVNQGFSGVEQVKKFRLIDVLLTAEDEELTPTMKLKRSFVSEKYGELIEAMYAS